jgi:hypothetical protein
MPTSKRMVIALLCVLSAVSLAACGGSTSSSSLVAGEASGRFLDESYSDWVSFADQLSVFSVVAEEEETPAPEVVERGEGYISRTVTLRIERTLWRRRGAPAAHGRIRVITAGWILEGGERHPYAIWGGPRLEVGMRYLAPLVRAPRDGVDWTPLSDGSTLPLTGNAITVAGVVGVPSAIAASLNGRSPDEVAAIVDRTPPDPVAEKYADLDPDARVQAVLSER